MREQQRKQAEQSRIPQERIPKEIIPQAPRAVPRTPLGAVTAEENESPAARFIERAREGARTALGANEMPDDVRAMMEASRRSKKKKADETQSEVVEEIVAPASENAYEAVAIAKRRIPLDKDALRTFVVTREVLGPPRYRKPHRPGIRGR